MFTSVAILFYSKIQTLLLLYRTQCQTAACILGHAVSIQTKV